MRLRVVHLACRNTLPLVVCLRIRRIDEVVALGRPAIRNGQGTRWQIPRSQTQCRARKCQPAHVHPPRACGDQHHRRACQGPSPGHCDRRSLGFRTPPLANQSHFVRSSARSRPDHANRRSCSRSLAWSRLANPATATLAQAALSKQSVARAPPGWQVVSCGAHARRPHANAASAITRPSSSCARARRQASWRRRSCAATQ